MSTVNEVYNDVINMILITIPEGLSESEVLELIELMMEAFEKWGNLERERISDNYVSV